MAVISDTNLHLWEQFKAVPKEYQSKIEAGRIKGFTSINPMWRIKVLTEKFGPCGIGWRIGEVVFKETATETKEIMVRCTLNLYVKENEKWSEAIPGTGGAKLVALETKGLNANDEADKMAMTDAISTACKLLGVGADIYLSGKGDDTNKYNKKEPSVEINDVKKYASFIEAVDKIKTGNDLSNYYLSNKAEIEKDEFKYNYIAKRKAEL